MLSRFMIVFVCLISWLTVAEARMYKWVDKDGVVQYSQTLPPSGEAEEVKPPPKPSAPSQASQPEPEKMEQKSAESDGPTAEEIAESDKIKQENCGIARSNLDLYTNLGRKLVKTPDGLYKRYTEEERQAEIVKAKEAIKEYCN